MAAWLPLPALAARTCADWHAELLGVEGDVAILPAGRMEWAQAAESDQVCVGDQVRTGDFGRAALELRDHTTMRLVANTVVRIGEPRTFGETIVDIFAGLVHVITRDPRELTFRTPYGNAGIEGTEFDIDAAPEATQIVVYEGVVRVTSATAAISVPAGENARASASGVTSGARARLAGDLQRGAYYPPILAGSLPAPEQVPDAALALDPAFFGARAAARLRYGQVAAAEADLADAERLGDPDGTARALLAMLALERGDVPTALALTAVAVDRAPRAAAPLIPRSYALEAQRETQAAADAIERAIAIEPENAVAWTRRAKLALGRNDVAASVDAASRAIGFDPQLASAHSVLGFAKSRGFDGTAAVTACERSIGLDPSAPQPRIGLAEALLRDGNRDGGRRELEYAVAVDPADALTRSYMGRVYDADNRDKVATSQLTLAKDLDLLDPTPWVYETARLLHENRPVEALRSVRAAESRNSNQTAFRSTLDLDEDLAAHGSSAIGHVHRELGFTQLGVQRGRAAAANDPTDHAGHRLLADLYSLEPRHELARVSEQQLALLMQPLIIAPLQAQLGQPSSFIQGSVGPSELAFTEFSPALLENGLSARVAAVGGANETNGLEAALAGIGDRSAFSAGYYDYATDGFRENNDLEQTIANLFFQYRVSAATSVQAELRSVETERGDLALLFHADRYSPLLRAEEAGDSLRLGVRHDFGSRDTLLVSSILQDVDTLTTVGELFSLAAGGDAYGIDLQEIHDAQRWHLQTGFGYVERDSYEAMQRATSPVPPYDYFTSEADFEVRQASVYAYAQIDLSSELTITAGASVDQITDLGVDEDAFNPKVGVVWQPSERVTLRAAAFTTLQGSLSTSLLNPQPRLEPTHVAGFNQFLLGANGDDAEVYGTGIDVVTSSRSYAGVETSRRDTVRWITTPGLGTEQTTIDETQHRAYFYSTPTDRTSVGIEYQYDRATNAPIAFFGSTETRTERVPAEFRYFTPAGLTFMLRATAVHQEGIFATAPAVPGPDQYGPDEDRFWVVDTTLGFRLPNRRGSVSLGVDNLLDEEFAFQDIDPENPSIMPERMGYVRFTVAFD